MALTKREDHSKKNAASENQSSDFANKLKAAIDESGSEETEWVAKKPETETVLIEDTESQIEEEQPKPNQAVSKKPTRPSMDIPKKTVDDFEGDSVTFEIKTKPVETSNEVFDNTTEQSAEQPTFRKQETKKMNASFNVSIKSSTTEDLQKFVENTSAAAKSFSGPAGLQSVSVELITNPTLICPVVAVIGKGNEGEYRASVLLIEKCAKPIPVETKTSGDRTIEIRRVISHGFDDAMRAAITAQLSGKGITEISYQRSHAVVDSKHDLSDEGCASIYAATAVLSIANAVNGTGSLSLSDVVKDNKELRNHIQIAPGMTDYNILGQPVASDFSSVVTINDKKVLNNNNAPLASLNGGQSVNQVLKLNAIMDVLVTRPKLQERPNSMSKTVTRFKPLIIATNIEGISASSTSIYEDTKSILLALASLSPFADSGNWKQIANRSARGSGKASVGVVGMYHNCDPNQQNKFAEIKVAETQDRATDKVVGPLDVIDDYFEQDMPVIGFDAVSGSRISWAMQAFVDAATADSKMARSAANKQILEAIDSQGKGGFSDVWGDRPIVKRLAIVHSGIVTTPDGKEVSLASFDNFQAMAACKGDVEMLKRILVNGGDVALTAENLHERLSFTQQLHNVELKSYANRLYFDPEFFDTYIQYLKASEIDVKYEGISSIQDNGLSGGFDTAGFNKFGGGFSAANQFSGNSGNGGFGFSL